MVVAGEGEGVRGGGCMYNQFVLGGERRAYLVFPEPTHAAREHGGDG